MTEGRRSAVCESPGIGKHGGLRKPGDREARRLRFALNPPGKCGNMDKSVNRYMAEALSEASEAKALGEVPVGAVIIQDGRIIARGHNRTETDRDPTAHAEMIALRQAAKALGGWRLPRCTMVVTLEPCSMCAGAIVWARIDRLIIGAMDPKAGACGSVLNIPQNERLNHYVEIETGVMAEDCSEMLRGFFRELRSRRNRNKSEDGQE